MKVPSALTIVAVLFVTDACLAEDKLPTAAGTIAIGGQGGWDYLLVDTTTQRLYVSHGTHVPIIDLDHSSIVFDIANTLRVHGIALARDVGRGFISNGGDSSMTVFDLKTDSTVARVVVTGANPDAILYDPVSRRVFTFNGRGANATAIDPKSLKVVGTIALDGKPEFAVTDNRGAIYVNIEDKSLVARIDPRTLTVTARWPLTPCAEPSGLAIDRAGHRLFSVGSNKLLAVVDADSGKVVTTLPIGERVDGVAFDPSTREIFSSNGEGTLTVIRQNGPDDYSVVGTLTTEPGARTIALDERTHRIYLPVGTSPDSTKAPRDGFCVLVYQE